MVNAEDKDGISTASATVTVFVQDTADEIPVFEQPKYQANLIEKMGWFCSQHNFKFLSILFHNKVSLYNHQTSKMLTNMDLRVKSIANMVDHLEDRDFIVIFYAPENYYKDWHALSHRRIKSSLFVVEQHHLDDLMYLIPQKKLSLNIYCLIHNESLLEFKELIALKNQTKVIIKNTDEKKIDLQGIHISSITGNWKPYVNTYNCDQFGKNCAMEGFSVDIMNTAAKFMNFTWSSEISSDWGMSPKSGPFNISGEWGGVMGNVILGNYDVSVNFWAMNLHRMELIDNVWLFKSHSDRLGGKIVIKQ